MRDLEKAPRRNPEGSSSLFFRSTHSRAVCIYPSAIPDVILLFRLVLPMTKRASYGFLPPLFL